MGPIKQNGGDDEVKMKPLKMFIGVNAKGEVHFPSLKKTEVGCKAQMLQDANKVSFADLVEKGWRVASVEIRESANHVA